jgi:hypothetical protein
MNTHQRGPLRIPTAPATSFTPVRSGLLQRKCACGGTLGPAGECEECSKKRLQRKTRNSELGIRNESFPPPIVREVLRSPGQALDAATRVFMEPRFAHDFSPIPVYPKAPVESQPPVPSFNNQSRFQTLQRKPDCMGTGKSALGFIGELDDGVFGLTPEDAQPTPPTDAPAVPTPMDVKDKPPSCSDVCDRAYTDSKLNKGGGGVVCDHGAKCPCVFDVPPLKRGQCPDLDTIVLSHETKHVSEGDCGSDPAPHRLGPKDPSTLIPTECKHRKESITELDAAIPNNKGDCKTGMQTIRDGVSTWVKANC